MDSLRILANAELMAALNATVDTTEPAEGSCDELAGLSDFFRDLMDNLSSRLQANEWGAMLINNNGDLSFYRSQIYTDGSSTRVSHSYATSDAQNIVSVLHNHPSQGGSIDRQNRYPSGDDWAAAGNLVSSGANASTLTLGIVAPDGSMRLFNYSDRAAFEALSDREKERGTNLPSEVSDEADTEPCVTIA